jgi:hypothetical protein
LEHKNPSIKTEYSQILLSKERRTAFQNPTQISIYANNVEQEADINTGIGVGVFW